MLFRLFLYKAIQIEKAGKICYNIINERGECYGKRRS